MQSLKPKWYLLFTCLFYITAISAQTIITTHDKVLIQTDPSRGSTDYSGWGVFPKDKNFQKMYCELSFHVQQE